MNELNTTLIQLEKNNPFKGSFFFNKSLKNISWLKVGGSAEYLYIPYDRKDLSNFLSMLSFVKFDFLVLTLDTHIPRLNPDSVK